MDNKNILSYLEDMKGKVLKIFKAGPESKTGRLINVNKDIIAIQTEDNHIVYYQLKHVKSIIEHAKSGFRWDNQEDLEVVKTNNFLEILQHLKEREVHVNGGGPSSRTGKLLDFNPDYLVLQTREDLIYYQLEHIKSISPVEKDEYDDDEEEYDEDPEYIQGTNLFALLKKLLHHWIILNSKGPEHIEGVLVDYTRDHILIVHHDEVFRVSTYHINSIKQGFKYKDKHNKEEDEQDKKRKGDSEESDESSEEESSYEESSEQESSEQESSSSESSSSESSEEESSEEEPSQYYHSKNKKQPSKKVGKPNHRHSKK